VPVDVPAPWVVAPLEPWQGECTLVEGEQTPVEGEQTPVEGERTPVEAEGCMVADPYEDLARQVDARKELSELMVRENFSRRL